MGPLLFALLVAQTPAVQWPAAPPTRAPEPAGAPDGPGPREAAGPRPLRGDTVPEGDTVQVTLTIREGTVDVNITYPPSPFRFVQVALPDWSGISFHEGLGPISATTSDGNAALVTPRGAGQWELPVGGLGFTLSYSLKVGRGEAEPSGPHAAWRPTVTADLGLVWGATWFVGATDPVFAALPVRQRLETDYSTVAVIGGHDGVKVFGPRVALGAGPPAGPLVHFRDGDVAARGLLVGGSLRHSTSTVMGLPIHLVAQEAAWRFEDAELLEAVAEIVTIQSRAIGVLPGAELVVVLLRDPDQRGGGLAEGETIVLFPDPDHELEDRDPETLRILAHEHLHRWIGEFAYGDPGRGEGRYKWFQEGVTEYLAFRTLARAGRLQPADFLFKVNQYIDGYHANPAAYSATADDLERAYWAEADYQRLAYQKGFLLAMTIDARIAAATDSRASLWDFVAAVAGSEIPVYDDDRLLGVLAALTGTDWSPFYDAYVLGSQPLDLSILCEDAGLDCERRRGGTRRLLATDRTAMALGRLIR